MGLVLLPGDVDGVTRPTICLDKPVLPEITRIELESKYYPILGDTVIGIIVKRLADVYKVDIAGTKDAFLSVTAFNGATKQNAPNLEVGDVVICGISCCHKDHDIILTCVSADENKTWSSKECYLGQLVGGVTFEVPLPLAKALVAEDCAILHLLGESIPYEIATGMNGICWLRSVSPKTTVQCINAIKIGLGATSFEELSDIINGKKSLEV